MKFGGKVYEVLSEVNFNGLDTSSVTDMSWMFHGCESLNSVDFSGFDTSSTRSSSAIYDMFEGCGVSDVTHK